MYPSMSMVSRYHVSFPYFVNKIGLLSLSLSLSRMAVNLTAGAIAMLSSRNAVAADVKPVLQVADVKLVNTQSISHERYRILLSDGVHLHQGMLATKKNDLVHCQRLQKGPIVQLFQFVCNVLQCRPYVFYLSHFPLFCIF